MNLAKLLENTAERMPQKVGLRFEGRDYTFQELSRLSNRMANGLTEVGIRTGDRCILMMQSCPEFIIAYYALAKMGSVIIPVNFLYKSHELFHIFRDSEAKAFIGMQPYLEEPRQVLAELAHMDVLIASGAEGSDFIPLDEVDGPDIYQICPVADVDPLAIFYTSGTTGLPKGAVLTHKNLYSNAMTVADLRETDPEDVVIGVLPLYHIYGQTSGLNASVYSGLTYHLFPQFDPEEVVTLIETEASTILIAVPTMYNRLILEAEQRGLKRSSLRFCISGGSSLPVEVLHGFEERFKTKIYEGYGLSECSPVCVENPHGGKTKPGSIGLPIPGFSARIVDDSHQDVEMGQVGELIIKGPGVMKEYLNQPEQTAEAVVDGWLHTGDLAQMDEEGYIYIVDRKKDMIIRGGYNIYPREVEEVLFQHPNVLEAAVYGVPHHDLGEEVAADVVLRAGANVTEEEVRQFVKEKVAPYKYPRIIRFVEDLPKTHIGKVLKKELRERWRKKKSL